MKNIYALMALSFFIGSACGQSQRLTIVEGFTQASCGPCAPQNPILHELVKNNPDKIISLKYQVSWPGSDPINAQNPGQPSSRVNYYGVDRVPYIIYNGNVNIGGVAPADLSQEEIDAQYNIPSPFNLDLSHTISADYDSVLITAAITATDNVNISTGTRPLRLHLLLVEKEINFDSPPGTNGERNFYNVMRRMIPTALGTAISSAWATGQDTVITIKAPIPSYIYNLSQLTVIGFIQNNNDKNIMQAAVTNPNQVSIKENHLDFKLNIFPNPANNNVNIQYSTENEKNISIKIMDALGKIVYMEEDRSAAGGKQTLTVDVAKFSPGIYFVQFIAGNKTEVKKINIIK